MSALKRCVACHQLSDPRAVRCWVCGGALVDDAPADHPTLPGGDGDVALRLIAWVVLVLGLAMVSLIVGIELALNWPGLLIPFGLVMVVVFGAIARTAYVHHQASKARPPAPSTGRPSPPGTPATSSGPSTGETILQGLALAAATVAFVIGLLILMGVAAIVLFLMVCFALIGAGSLH